jgi:hypothetical protein
LAGADGDKEGHMKANDPDSVKRWRAVVDFYAEFASMKHWEFLAPMIGLAEWVGKQVLLTVLSITTPPPSALAVLF